MVMVLAAPAAWGQLTVITIDNMTSIDFTDGTFTVAGCPDAHSGLIPAYSQTFVTVCNQPSAPVSTVLLDFTDNTCIPPAITSVTLDCVSSPILYTLCSGTLVYFEYDCTLNTVKIHY